MKKLVKNSTLKKTEITVSGPITSWKIEGEKVETVTDFIFLGSQITVDDDCSHKIKRWMRMRWLDITDSLDMSLSKLLEIVKCRASWRVAVYGASKSQA